MTVGERIRARREELGLSQGDLAKKMNVSRQAISKAEHYADNITTDKVSKFAKALDCTEYYLMGYEEKLRNHLEEQRFLENFNDLNEEQKRQIVELLAFFKHQNNK